MDPFLKQVARHYYSHGNIGEKCFIFPNRRSAVFFKEYLACEVRTSGVPILLPRLLTINDFFLKVSGGESTDRIRLLPILYEQYCALYREAEPLDDFIFWGDVLLSDFDDMDKYLVDAASLLTNIADLKSIRDSYSYLSDSQRAAIEEFVAHFREGSGWVKANFLKIWNILLPLYRNFRNELRLRGLGYEGMVYRDVAERMDIESAAGVLKDVFQGSEGFVFVGLNALNECEKKVLRKMRDAHIAEFVWDWCGDFIRHPHNKSSFFLKDNYRDFPQAFEIEGGTVPEVNLVSVPSAVGQVKLIPSILARLDLRESKETAIVLPDETLLMSVLDTIPPEVGEVNITMGYPLGNSSLYSLIDAILRMQLRIREVNGELMFFHREAGAIFASGVFRALLSKEEAAAIEAARSERRYYIERKALGNGPVIDKVFRRIVTEDVPSIAQNHALEDYLLDILSTIGTSFSGKEEMMLEVEFAKRFYTSVAILKDTDLELKPSVWIRVLERMVSGITVPFNGEPLRGLQIMGPLETRALDFRNIILIGANEGTFPRRSVSSSFIPPELRKAFGLPTYEFQDAVWAYYFYRMISRAEKLWMICDNRTEGLKTGEESRYIKQLEYHFGVHVNRISAEALPLTPELSGDIDKTDGDVEVIKATKLSASALKNYLLCPAKFYYQIVKKLQAEDSVAETMDERMTGNVFHKTMEQLYGGDRHFPKTITRKMLQDWRSDKQLLRAIIEENILAEMKAPEVRGRNIVVADVILEYVLITLKRDIELLDKAGQDSFTMLGVEKWLDASIDGLKFHGGVDRMDSIIPGQVRIVDYKTGKVGKYDTGITDENAEKVAGMLFDEDSADRPLIALQLFLYDHFTRENKEFAGKKIFNSVYSPAALFVSGVESSPLSEVFYEKVRERLSGVLAEITSTEVPFRRTGDVKTCTYCDFKMICGR